MWEFSHSETLSAALQCPNLQLNLCIEWLHYWLVCRLSDHFKAYCPVGPIFGGVAVGNDLSTSFSDSKTNRQVQVVMNRNHDFLADSNLLSEQEEQCVTDLTASRIFSIYHGVNKADRGDKVRRITTAYRDTEQMGVVLKISIGISIRSALFHSQSER